MVRFINTIVCLENYIAAFYENVCIYPGLESETLNFARHLIVYFYITLFLHNLSMLSANLPDNIQYLMYFPFKLAEQNNGHKNHIFSFFGCT